MNKFIKISSLLLLLPFMQSCFMQQEDLFDNSAMERLEAKKTEALDVLSAAPNGWEMQYFVTGEAGKRGYVLLVNFEKSGDDGVVTFAAKNAITNNKYIVTDGTDPNYPKSYFDVVFDNGPVLTFNSYNNLFHKFSDPNGGKLPGDGGLGIGLGGDYEFTIISLSPDKVILKGKKRATYTVLTRLPENLEWKEYFNQLDEVNNTLYVNNPAPLKMEANGLSMYLYNGVSSIYDIVLAEDDDLTYSVDKKFLQTINGVRFEVPLEIEEEISKVENYYYFAGQEFYFNEDKSKMVSYVENDPSKGVLATISSVSPLWFYTKILSPNKDGFYVADWQISEENMGPKFKEKYDAMKTALEQKGRTNLELFLGGLSSYGDALQFQAKNITRNNYWIQLSRENSEENESLKYALGTEKSNYYDVLVKNFPEVADFVSCLEHEFNIQLIRPFNLSSVRLVAVDDPEISFELSYVVKK